MKKLTAIFCVLCLLLCGCDQHGGPQDTTLPQTGNQDPTPPETVVTQPTQGSMEPKVEVQITCTEGDADCFSISGSTILFSGMTQDSIYQISGELVGNIVIEAGEDLKFELELTGLRLSTDTECPIVITSGDKVTITAKKSTENFIYDWRPAVSEEEYAGAIHSECDMILGGKGSLSVYSANNNGVHGKDDLQVKNLTLSVDCMDNALKGNDSVTVNGGDLTLIARQGDGIKTSNSDISSKGNQRGTVTLSETNMTIYAACDGIDAAYDVVIDDSTTSLRIYTDKYSPYSETVDQSQSGSEENLYYIRYNAKTYHYAVKYYNSDTDYQWVIAEYHSSVSGGRSSYYYYSFPIYTQYAKIQYFGYTADQTPGQEEDYAFCTDYLTVNTDSDTFAISQRGNQLTYSWSNYSTSIQDGWGGGPGGMGGGFGGPGGMQQGNPDKGDYSTKGIKAANAITIYAGTIQIQSYDDAIHANQESTLENGESPTGDIAIHDGSITIYSNDDGIHADGDLTVSAGIVTISNCYEGLEGTHVTISGGDISIVSSDDGINSTVSSGEGIRIDGGTVYVYSGGDGLDANSTSSYAGIHFNGGKTVIICNSNGNSAIDTERGYQYSGGSVLALTSQGGMSGETTNCKSLNSIGKTANLSLSTGKYVTVNVDGDLVLTVKMPCNLNATAVYLGSANAKIDDASSSNVSFDKNGVCWNISKAM